MKIFDIKRSSVNDGDGIRTVVFFKSCPLRCIWCHNPEGLSMKTDIAYYAEKCISCGMCVSVCESEAQRLEGGAHIFDPSVCTGCGKCVSICPASSMQSFGYTADTDSIFDTLMRDADYFRFSGGGVTFSGGEPMAQAKEATELAKKLKENGIPVFIETSGYGDPAAFAAISEYIDTFLFDIKQIPPLYKKYTGVDGHTVLKNLRMLNGLGANIVLRCPVIPGINMVEGHFCYIASLAKELCGVKEVDLMPYHPAGLLKYDALQRECLYRNTEFLEKKLLEGARAKIEKRSGKKCRID